MGEAQSKAHWQADDDAPTCNDCHVAFSLSVRRHHCRNCGFIFCDDCCHAMCSIPQRDMHAPVRVCRTCYAALGGGRRRRAAQQQQQQQQQKRRQAQTAAAAVSATEHTRRHHDTTTAAAATPTTPTTPHPAASATATAAAAATSTAADSSPSPAPPHARAYDNDVYSATWDRNGAAATTVADATTAVADATSSPLPSTTMTTSLTTGGAALSSLYGDAGNDAAAAYDESERLAQRWTALRQVTRLDDVLLQRVEAVDVHTTVDYCREVEQVTLQPELPHAELCRTLFALPPADARGGVASVLQPQQQQQQPTTTAAITASDMPLLQLLLAPPRQCDDGAKATTATRVHAMLRDVARRTARCTTAATRGVDDTNGSSSLRVAQRVAAMRRSVVVRRPYRPYYNLPSQSTEGRRMTGFLTPYRHWMWKQNELWRNVHEAQFEHLRRVYKRQWLESFRVNADEYIYKYNITKAAQLAQWEYEMQAQEKKRREAQQMAHGRVALKKKHLDLLREYHERQFFYWYERASERLQYMTHIRYVKQSDVVAHIEREMDKYVAGAAHAYPLNFAGQLPMLEDREGNIVQVPHNLLVNHASEHMDSRASMYTPPQGSAQAEAQLLQMMASAQEEELQLHLDNDVDDDVDDTTSATKASAKRPRGGGGGGGGAMSRPHGDDADDDTARVLSETVDTLEQQEAAREANAKVARSMEESEAERAIARRAYIDRGKTGSRALLRRPKLDSGGGGGAVSTGVGSGTFAASGDAGGGSSGGGVTPGASDVVDVDVDEDDDDSSSSSSKANKASDEDTTPMRRRKSHADRQHAMQMQQDALMQQLSARRIAAAAAADADQLAKRGEVRERRGRLRDTARQVAATEKLMERPEVRAMMSGDTKIRAQDMLKRRYQLGKYKPGNTTGDDTANGDAASETRKGSKGDSDDGNGGKTRP